eukprot:TRINITY_DN14611_c0_g1_i1.p1 TRINITY_DN14611_c0_g1~~TRINITY_DN14611_c0_g1_i1.p1  ORF type:complete len:168 (+),score=23.16 TRINITY_DN14611_c0_g1_i1:95-598(+)
MLPNAFLFVAVAIAAMGAILFGFSAGYTSPTTVTDCSVNGTSIKLNCDLKLSNGVTSWMGSIVNIGAAVSAVGGGPLADLIGRRKTILISGLIMVVSYALISFAPSPSNDATSASGGTIAMVLGILFFYLCDPWTNRTKRGEEKGREKREREREKRSHNIQDERLPV